MSSPKRTHKPQAAAKRKGSPIKVPISRGCPVYPAGPAPDDGVGRFPFIVVRLMATVYQTEKVKVRPGMSSAHVGAKTSYLQHPSPFKSDGQISDEARDLLLAEVLAA